MRSELPGATDTFCGRASELLAIEKALDPEKSGQRGVVLCGIGGSGKTQLTLRYIEQHFHLYTAIIWINATTLEHTQQSFAEAADLISSKWPAPDLPVVYIGPIRWRKVVARLHSTCHKDWLLVIDSVDDLTQDNFRQYIPSCKHGSIIVTSTQRQAPEVFRFSELEVDCLDLDSSRELLFACTSGSIENAVVSEDGKSGGAPLENSLTGIQISTTPQLS